MPNLSIPSTPPATPLSKRRKISHQPIFSPGELGKLARQFARTLKQLGWTKFYGQHQPRHYTSLHPSLHRLNHPAARLLHRLATHGVPAPSSEPPWSTQQKDAAAYRGPHPSASRVFSAFLLEDMFEMVNMGFWLVLPYSAIRHHSQLKIAPAGVVPQRDRRPRPIMDYTFNSVNQASLPIAPLQSMQFGRAFQRLLQRIAYSNPAFGPVQMAKIDLADGYYRIPISPQASLALAVVLPSDGLSEPLLGLPLSLPMGWSHSPPYFCAFTETCADLANTHAPTNPSHPFQYALLPSPAAHPSEPTFTASTTFPFNPHPPQEQTKYTDVYLDDFMLLAQHPHTMPVMNNLLHHLSNIL
jgi:hypothetical protein